MQLLAITVAMVQVALLRGLISGGSGPVGEVNKGRVQHVDRISALVACMSALFFLNSVILLAMCCESRLDILFAREWSIPQRAGFFSVCLRDPVVCEFYVSLLCTLPRSPQTERVP